jgi:DNA-binding MarR family transcriptional regulator
VKREPKINLGGLDQFTGYVVRRAQVWIFQDFKRALKELDMTPAQFSVMKIVAANPGIAQARVAEVLCIERARLVQMLDRLEAPRLIDRTRSAIDRRSHALYLTDAGAEVLERLQERIEAHERNVVARIGAKGKSDLLRLLAPFLR